MRSPSLPATCLLLSATLHAAPVTARKSDAFVDSIAVNLHLGYDNAGGVYTQFEQVKACLQNIGIRHYRDGLENPDIKQAIKDRHNELGRAGIRGTFLTGGGLTPAQCLASANLVADSLEAFEGQNEILNIYVKWDDAKRDAARRYQKDLFRAINADPRWKDTPVLGPTGVGHAAYEALGDLSAHMDFGNIHPYPLGHAPAVAKSNLFAELESGKLVSGRKKMLATETGYTTGTSDSGNQRVSPAAAGKYAPRLYLENFNRGILRTFWYELCDQGTDGSQESSFGLVKKDFTRKPQATALKNLIGLLTDAAYDPAEGKWKSPSFTPGMLDFTLAGDTADVRTILLQKSDGTFYLCLWQEVDSYDIANNVEADIKNTDAAVTLTLAAPVTGAMAYRPSSGTDATGIEVVDGKLELKVPDEVLVLALSSARTSEAK